MSRNERNIAGGIFTEFHRRASLWIAGERRQKEKCGGYSAFFLENSDDDACDE